MRAPQPRAFLCAAVLLAAPLACTKASRNTNVKIAGEADGAGEVARTAPPGAAGRDVPRGPVEKIELSGSLVGVGDMLDAGSKLMSMWSPPEPGAPQPDLRFLLDFLMIQQGFGSGFLPSLDLDGVHAFELAFPHEGQRNTSPADVELRVAMSALDPVRMVESMPAMLQPQPLGQNLWQFTDDSTRLYFRAQADALEIAMTLEDLDVATGLRAKVPAGPTQPRIHLTGANLPPGEIDVTELIPLPPGLARPLSSILNETASLDLAADFGTDRDLTARLGAAAPFERLGLDPIGPATQAPSKLAKALPSEALFVWNMPWGDPALLHGMLDKQIPISQIPAPFDGYVGDVLAGAHAVLGQVRDEVIAAAYIDNKGQVTLVFAAEVGDEKAALAAMRKIWTSTEKAMGDHIALTGGSAEFAYTASFKQGAVTAGKAKADLLSVTVPKFLHRDVEKMSWLFGAKPKLEVSTLAVDGKLVIAIGAGHKGFMGALGRSLGKKGEGLEAGGGLALARKLGDGCQYCVALDPERLFELFFTVQATSPDEPEEVRKAAKDALKKLAKLDLDGEIAFAIRLEQGRGLLGFGVPKSLLFADPIKVKTLMELVESVEEARRQAWTKKLEGTPLPKGSPGGVQGGKR
jgi:hypothetical protein